jgi:hypothetical protein
MDVEDTDQSVGQVSYTPIEAPVKAENETSATQFCIRWAPASTATASDSRDVVTPSQIVINLADELIIDSICDELEIK